MTSPTELSVGSSELNDRDFINPLTSTTDEFKTKNLEFKENDTRFSMVAESNSELSLPLKNFDDTVHYLSPASTLRLSDRTDNEGDFLGGLGYKTPSFMRFLEQEKVPSLGTIIIPCDDTMLQRTLAMIKPEAMEYEEVILRAIEEAGFTSIRKRYLHLTPEQVSEIYAQYYGNAEFPYLVVTMSSGPILALSMARKCAVEKWKNMVGPEGTLRAEWFYPMSMRARFGLIDDIPGVIHASETIFEANKENRYINPDSVLEPIASEKVKVWDYCNMFLNSTLLNGLTDVVRRKPIDPILHLADWLLKHNPFQPQFPESVAVLPT